MNIVNRFIDWFRTRKAKLGVGIVLVRKESDGTIWVASRLLQSPAGREGVQLYERVISINGRAMFFSSNLEFAEWAEDHPSILGKPQTWVFANGQILYLHPELIKEEIPVYWIPEMAKPINPTHEGAVRPGLEYCNKTGQYIPKSKLSQEAIREAYFGS